MLEFLLAFSSESKLHPKHALPANISSPYATSQCTALDFLIKYAKTYYLSLSIHCMLLGANFLLREQKH